MSKRHRFSDNLYSSVVEIMTNLSDLINKELVRRGISQNDLADAIDVTQGHISRILSGERGASEKILRRISSFLVIPMEDIYMALGRIPPKTKTNPLRDEINSLLDRLTEEDERKFLSFLGTFLERQDEKKQEKGKK